MTLIAPVFSVQARGSSPARKAFGAALALLLVFAMASDMLVVACRHHAHHEMHGAHPEPGDAALHHAGHAAPPEHVLLAHEDGDGSGGGSLPPECSCVQTCPTSAGAAVAADGSVAAALLDEPRVALHPNPHGVVRVRWPPHALPYANGPPVV